METLSNYFQTNSQSFREAVLGTFYSQTLSPTANPQSVPTDAFQQDWKYQFMCPFPPFLKVQRDKTNMIIVTPSWQSQSWYPILFKMTIKNPILLSNHPRVLLSPEGEIHLLIQNTSLRLVASLVLDKVIFNGNIRKGYRPYLKCQKNRFSNRVRIDLVKVG